MISLTEQYQLSEFPLNWIELTECEVDSEMKLYEWESKKLE